MTTDRAQAERALCYLTIACRPHRAPTWDEAGIMAALAKVRHLSLPEVMIRVALGAGDRDAKTPAVISTDGPHNSVQLKPERWQPTRLDPAERCSVCSHEQHDGKCPRCAPNDDHKFAADFKRTRAPEAAALIAASIHEEMRNPTMTEEDVA